MKKALYFLGILDDSDLDWMIAAGRKRAVAEGTTLIQIGKHIDTVFFVLDGAFSVLGPDDQKEIARLGAGEIIGEMSFVDSRPPSATVRAVVNSLVLAIPRSELTMRLDEHVSFAARFYKALAIFLSDRLRSMVSHLGYGQELKLEEDIEDTDELATHLMDVISLAGNRFSELQRRAITG
jgi:CRP/FNR family transcriptional regulator, cyclic AMP receptor protein